MADQGVNAKRIMREMSFTLEEIKYHNFMLPYYRLYGEFMENSRKLKILYLQHTLTNDEYVSERDGLMSSLQTKWKELADAWQNT